MFLQLSVPQAAVVLFCHYCLENLCSMLVSRTPLCHLHDYKELLEREEITPRASFCITLCDKFIFCSYPGSLVFTRHSGNFCTFCIAA